MTLPKVAKWLGIYLICNLTTAAVVVVAFFLSLWLWPPMSSQRAVAVAKIRMEEDYIRDKFREEHTTDCTVENYPDGAFRAGQAYDVTCSILKGSYVVARTTFIFGKDGLAGHDDWELDGQDDQ